ncbi:hypothetical protein JCM18237_22630 [Halorubrum luteum]
MSGVGRTRREDHDHARRAERDDRPPVSSVVAAAIAGGVALSAGFLAEPTGGALVGVAAVGLVLGTLRGSHRVLSWSAGAGVVGLGVAGYLGAAPEPLLVAAAALAVAWDVGDHGVSLGRQVGRDASTRRNVVAHAGVTVLVGGTAVGVTYVAYVLAAGGQPVTALAFLLLGAVVVASTLR